MKGKVAKRHIRASKKQATKDSHKLGGKKNKREIPIIDDVTKRADGECEIPEEEEAEINAFRTNHVRFADLVSETLQET
jgi:hypothetical protein